MVSFKFFLFSGRITALASTQPLTEMSTRIISWGVNAAGAHGWQLLHFHVPCVLKTESLNLLEPSGPFQVCTGIAVPLAILVMAQVWILMSERMEEITIEETRMPQRGAISISCIKV